MNTIVLWKVSWKQWWSTIPPISTKQATTSHLNSLNTKKTMTNDIWNPGPLHWTGTKNMAGLNRLLLSLCVCSHINPLQTSSVVLNISMLVSSVVDNGFKPQAGQTKDHSIGICCFSAKHAALRRKSKDGFARNQDKVSMRSLCCWKHFKNPTSGV